MISGFESISSGDIFLDGKTIGSIPAHKRNFGMLFQNYALFPHMTVAENVAYPLKIRHTPKAVSYTHLDVYKRQVVYHYLLYNNLRLNLKGCVDYENLCK